ELNASASNPTVSDSNNRLIVVSLRSIPRLVPGRGGVMRPRASFHSFDTDGLQHLLCGLLHRTPRTCCNPKRMSSGSNETEMEIALNPPPPLRRHASIRTGELAEEGTDGELLVRIADGDRVAFDGLYRRYVRSMFGLALRRLGDRGRAEDAVQETF